MLDFFKFFKSLFTFKWSHSVASKGQHGWGVAEGRTESKEKTKR